jgi:DNA-binding CsgD family transcriptional regulator
MTTREQERSLISLRRSKISEMLAKGYANQAEIARALNISEPTCSRDIAYLTQMARTQIQDHIETRIPMRYFTCETGLNIVLRNAYEIYNNPNIRVSEKLQSLSLISETYGKLMTLSTDEKTIAQAINWIENKKKGLQQELQQQVLESVHTQSQSFEEEQPGQDQELQDQEQGISK